MEVERAELSLKLATDLIKKFYDLNALEMEELSSYDSKNFSFRNDNDQRYLLKVSNSEDSRRQSFLDMQNKVMLKLSELGQPVPRPLKSRNGHFVEFENLRTQLDTSGRVGDRCHAMRLFTFIPGESLSMEHVKLTASLAFDVGRTLARFDALLTRCCFELVDQPPSDEEWTFRGISGVHERSSVISDANRRNIVMSAIQQYEKEVQPLMDRLTPSVVHGDPSLANILVDAADPMARPGPDRRVVGLLDWEECHRGCAVFELGTACAYLMAGHSPVRDPEGLGPLELARECVRGYCAEWRLPQWELRLLPTLVIARLAQEYCLTLYTATVLDPGNDYLLSDLEDTWSALQRLADTDLTRLAEIGGGESAR